MTVKTINSKEITKISDIEKEVECLFCNKGKRKIEYFIVHIDGKLSVRYGDCSTHQCPEKKGIRYPTDIIIESLVIEKEKQESIREIINDYEERTICISKNCSLPDHIEHKHEGYDYWHPKLKVHNKEKD